MVCPSDYNALTFKRQQQLIQLLVNQRTVQIFIKTVYIYDQIIAIGPDKNKQAVSGIGVGLIIRSPVACQ